MSESEICQQCGKPLGTGTLLDQYPKPPEPRTSVHRLYLLIKDDFSNFPSKERQETVLTEEEWIEFASTHSCIVCATYLDNEGARYGFE